LGFCLDGEYYVFTVLPFGAAAAPRLYTALNSEVYLCLRSLGMQLVSVLDDVCSYGISLAQTQAQCAALVDLLTALGFHLSPDKCQWPTWLLRFLGLLVDSLKMVFQVPDDKLDAFMTELDRLVAARTASNRELASIAGKLLSFRLAVDIAPIQARALYQAMQASPGAPAKPRR
jgi:hypothetical protein